MPSLQEPNQLSERLWRGATPAVENPSRPRELVAQPLQPCARGHTPQLEAFRRAAEPVEPLQRLLARPGRVGQLLLGTSALGQQRLEPLLRLPPTAGSLAPPCRKLREPLLEPREIQLRDARPQPRHLDPELLA